MKLKREIAGVCLGAFITAAGMQVYNVLSPPPSVPSSGISPEACMKFDRLSAGNVQEIVGQFNRSILGGYEIMEKNGYYKAIIPQKKAPIVVDVHHMHGSSIIVHSQYYDAVTGLLGCGRLQKTENVISEVRKINDDYTRRVTESLEQRQAVKPKEKPYIPEFPEIHNPYEGRTLRINHSADPKVLRLML